MAKLVSNGQDWCLYLRGLASRISKVLAWRRPPSGVKFWTLLSPNRAEMLKDGTLGGEIREGAPLGDLCDALASDAVVDWRGSLCGQMTWIFVIGVVAEPLIAISLVKSSVILEGAVMLSFQSLGGWLELGTDRTWVEF